MIISEIIAGVARFLIGTLVAWTVIAPEGLAYLVIKIFGQ
jgi:hypothetical protein